jgi:hypothetical protein
LFCAFICDPTHTSMMPELLQRLTKMPSVHARPRNEELCPTRFMSYRRIRTSRYSRCFVSSDAIDTSGVASAHRPIFPLPGR